MGLNEVNARLKPRNIKGKDYIEVNQRILGFWELYPDGRIVTVKTADDGDRCDFRAEVYVGDVLKATGHAYEIRSASMVNKTSYIENCETSAVGRALGMLGIGSTESIASAEEVEAAIAQQEADKPAKPSKKPTKAATVSEVEAAAKRAAEAGRMADREVEDAKQRMWAEVKDYCAELGSDPKAFIAQLFAHKPADEWTAEDFDSMAADLRDKRTQEALPL